MDLSVESVERNIGEFRADIICRNAEDNSLVVVENQLETANHDHLGKLFTYAAGLEGVKTLVWIVKELREDHRAALDWLNRITHDDYTFFGVEVELWRIARSPLAPRFNVVVQPNDWTRQVQEAATAARGDLTDGQALQVAYWTSFGKYLRSIGSNVKPPKPYPTNWVGYGGLGRSGAGIVLVLNRGNATVKFQIDRYRHPTWFSQLQQQSNAIDQELGFSLQWIDSTKQYAKAQQRIEVDATDMAQWPNLHKWMAESVIKLRRVLRPRVLALDPTAPADEEDIEA
ncbi:MAG: DUF4268 domain-containing protein [Planctomycetes bacterium]|nr:DUF4268 domain-containing protein [Planctomycetota bacterium]MCW8134471.1 DUF4268 domain-containing protein [Planctomycetota bacterium]